MTKNRFRESLLLSAVGTFAVAGAIFGISALIDPANRIPFVSTAYAAPPELASAEVEKLIEERAEAADYSKLPDQSRATWDIVANVLYRELAAYDLHFELTDDPVKNCARGKLDLPGGCYHTGGEYDTMIFISPEVDAPNAEFIGYHEYSHHLQHIEGGTRFVEDIECDADLRAAELMGGWSHRVFQRQCDAAGLSPEDMALENLPNLEAELTEKRG